MSVPVDARSGLERRMTALDASFYYLERTGQLLHVGSVATTEARVDFTRLTADLEGRLHLIPRYTERVVPVPFGLAHPTWEPDPHFDIANHVVRHALRPPGDDHQLVGLAGRLFAQPLDRDRPLWELHLIDGYRGDRSAIFGKVHHCMIDGVSGVQLLGVMYDASPNPQPPPPAPPVTARSPLPSPVQQLRRAVEDGAATARMRLAALVELLGRPQRAFAEASAALDAFTALGRMLLAPVPATPFNGHVSILRRVLWTTFPLNEVKAIKNRLGGTVNDIVLTVISAALRGYLQGLGSNPDRLELRALVPVNVRTASEHLHLGNRVSMMVAPLPVGIHDALERHRQVRTAMAQLKAGGTSEHVGRALDLMALLPPLLQRPLGWMQVQAAPVNTICTNVPGPPLSLYVQGTRLETLVPIVPLAQGVGLAFAIMSYADTLTIGVTLDPALVRDGERFCELLQAGYAELSRLAQAARLRSRGGSGGPGDLTRQVVGGG